MSVFGPNERALLCGPQSVFSEDCWTPKKEKSSQRMTEIATDDLRQYDLRGRGADGEQYALLPEQVALMVEPP